METAPAVSCIAWARRTWPIARSRDGRVRRSMKSRSAWPSTESRISPRRPETVRPGGSSMRTFAPPGIFGAVLAVALAFASGGAAAGPPGYEPAYFGGETVTINAIEVKQNEHVLEHASAELYAVVYPLVARNAGLVPQCNPCDHAGNGIDPGDFHDHVLDSIPADPGGGEFSPLWHVLAVRPNYTAEAAVDAFTDAGYAVEVDTGHYFLCSVVNLRAAG